MIKIKLLKRNENEQLLTARFICFFWYGIPPSLSLNNMCLRSGSPATNTSDSPSVWEAKLLLYSSYLKLKFIDFTDLLIQQVAKVLLKLSQKLFLKKLKQVILSAIPFICFSSILLFPPMLCIVCFLISNALIFKGLFFKLIQVLRFWCTF